MATDEEKQTLLKSLASDNVATLKFMPDFGDMLQNDDIETTKRRVQNMKEIERRIAKLRKRGDEDFDANIRVMQDIAQFSKNPDMELPRAFDADEMEAKVFVEPMPIIYPPKDWTSRKNARWDYSELPTSTSIRLLKLKLLDDYEPWDEEEERGPESHSPIKCSIEVVDLTDQPDFFALSYTWGDPRTIYTDKSEMLPPGAWHAPSFEINCDGKPVTVTANLYNALIALRSAWSGGDMIMEWGPYYVPQKGDPSQVFIWIDQLCINQDDTAEKNVQVPMMDRIYQQARATMIWLGGGERLATAGTKNTMIGVTSVIEKFREILDVGDEDYASRKTTNIWRNSKAVQEACSAFDLREKKSYTALGLDPIEPEELIGWYLMFSRSWFRRAWIVQEWALSETCLFICGAASLHQRNVLDLMQHFWTTGWLGQIMDLVRDNTVDPETGGVPSWNETPTPHHRALCEPRWGGEARDTMPVLYRPAWANIDPASEFPNVLIYIQVIRMEMGFDITRGVPDEQRRVFRKLFVLSLESFRSTQATDPRDKVFAFYSLFKNDDGTPLYPSPDYTKTVRQVFTEAALTMAKQFGPRFLGFLGSNDYYSNEHDLPSWVTDLSRNTSGKLQLCPSGTELYNASIGLPELRSLRLLDGDILQLRGCHIDTISQVQENPLGACDLVHGFRELHQILHRLPAFSEICTPDGAFKKQSRYEVYWRTKIHDCDKNDNYPAAAEVGKIHLRRLDRFLTGQITHAAIRTVKQNIDEVLEESSGSSPLDSFLVECLENLACPESEDHSIKVHCETLIKQERVQMDSSKEFDRERHSQAITVINTYLSMLKGDISFDDYEGVVPDSWTEYVEAFEDLARARQARDYTRFRDVLRYIMYEMPQKFTDLEQAHADILEGQFTDSTYFFVTHGGRLGQNPGGAEVGDEIWVLAGLHAPIILRKVYNGRHRVVGCAYVHGVMHGEGIVGEKVQNVQLV